uniref:Si:ch73-379j16.2 n=1 Tax=Gadus morhua TaxID=8049 RepID=A0A8C5B3M5_GADMO
MRCGWLSGVLLLCFVELIWAQLRYSIAEEGRVGAVVGHVAKDLGLDISTLVSRRFRIVSGTNHALFNLNLNNGVLHVEKKIDREELCETNICVINLKVVVENPLEIHYVAVEITDVNDHSPTFPDTEQHLEIPEHIPPGTRFQIHAARDPDVGINAVRFYRLSTNDLFDFEVTDSEEDKIPFLVLKKPLDRENQAEHVLVLTALDGGNPSKSGKLNLTITVLDTNDNRPIFSQDTYTVSLVENAPFGTLVVKLNATDLDLGLNSEIEYSFGKTQKKKVLDAFSLDSITGEIRVKGMVDFEDTEIYRVALQASDKGQPPWNAEGRVIIKIKDVNDNNPDIEITSLSNVVPEDVKAGSVIALISVTDRDAGDNGKVKCTISQNVPFDLTPSIQDNMYSLVVKGQLDRELKSDYEITITATDCGQPPLSTVQSLSIHVSDVNDNAPKFSRSPIELYLVENNIPSASIFSVSAFDNDLNENAAISYKIVRGDGPKNEIASFLNINNDNGQIFAMKSFDFESLKSFQFKVVAIDSGTPPLSGNVTINTFILDQNDNAPVIMYPVSSNGTAEGIEEVPRNVPAGHLVTKVRAYDADIGYNGWLLFSLQEVSDHSLFGLDRYTGRIRTLRSFTETDEAQHKLVILVKDNGNMSLSATATVVVKLVEPKEDISASDVKGSTQHNDEDNLSFYLIITLSSVSALFLISIIVLIAMQCTKTTDLSSKYLPETNYDGTLCHSIQYRSGEKRYMLVGPRMSIGSTIVPGSNGNTLVVPDRRSTSAEEVSDHSLFGLDRYTGRIRTMRSFTETDEAQHKLVILVKDNGNVSLLATATVIVKLVEPKEAISASDVKSVSNNDNDTNVTLYLMITLGTVSTLFIFSIIVLIAMQCSKTTDVSTKYLPETNYDGTLCHSIQYRSGEKRYMLVGPRMSIGSTIVLGSNGNTLVVPDRRSTSVEHPVQIWRETLHVSWTQNEYRIYYSPGEQWEHSSGP